MESLENARIYRIRPVPFRQLNGFEKHHDIPNTVNHRSLDWLEQLTRAQLDSELQTAFAAIRSAYGLKRRQLNVHGPQDRRGVIETPFFNFEMSVDLDKNEPDQVLWTREINQIRDMNRIVSPEFEQCFASSGWNLEVNFTEKLDLEEIVDRIEDQEGDGYQVEYDKDLFWCDINIPESKATLRATAYSFIVTLDSNSSPRQLLMSLIQFQSQLVDRIEPSRLQDTNKES